MTYRWRPFGSVRSRILGGSVLLLAAAFASSTAALHIFLTGQLSARVNAQLSHEIAEFRVLEAQRAASGDSGNAGSGGGAADPLLALLRARISQAVLERDTVLVGLIGGRIVAISGNSSAARLGASPATLARWSAAAAPASAFPASAFPASRVPASAFPASRVPASAVPASRVPASAFPASAAPADEGSAGEGATGVGATGEGSAGEGSAGQNGPAAGRAGPVVSTASVSGAVLLADGPAQYRAVPARVPGSTADGVFVAVVLTGQSQAGITRITQLQAEVGAVALLLGTAVAWLIAGRVLRPLRQTTELARRITDTDISHRIPVPDTAGGRRRGRSEISELAHTLNRMLDRLEAALSAQRRFLADAGHELRTPITILQGNLDTLQVSTQEDAATLDVVSDELTRMARLVGELTLLARSEQPDFLRPRTADLGELTRALAAKARALDPAGDQRITVTSSARGHAVLDPQRITQAVMQLAANAFAHTPPGTAIEISSAITGGTVEFRVADHGPGIPPELRERVFERFARLDSRRTDGSGLGLSIVAAICAAHGGGVRLTDRCPAAGAAAGPAADPAGSPGTGGGAVFTVSIPLRRDPPRPARPGHPAGPAFPSRQRQPAGPAGADSQPSPAATPVTADSQGAA